MILNTMVDILRKAEEDRINENPAYVKVRVRQMKDNGYGILIPDLSKPVIPYDIGPVRIASATSPVLQKSGTVDVMGITNDFILVGKYTDVWIVEGLIFEWNAMKFKTFKPTFTTRYGEILSIVAHLDNVTENSTADLSTLVLGNGTVATIVLGG